jgi:arylsulfatase A-like enzyme
MIQGRYSAETGIRHMFPGFPPREREFTGIVTLARDAGYRTIAISDFAGDIFPRFAGGFDVIKAPSSSLGVLIRQNIDQMFPLFNPVITSSAFRRFFPSLKESPVYAAPAHLEDLLKESIDEALLAHRRSPSLFISLFYSTAHFPYASPWPYYRQFSQRTYKGPFWFQKNPGLSGEDQSMDDSQKNQVRALYDGALHSVDDSLARVFSHLRESGIWDNAIIVLTADHGEDLFDPGILQGHGDHLRGDQTLRVPLLIKLPAKIAASLGLAENTHIDDVTRSIDLAPTLAALAGLSGFPEPSHSLQGANLTSLFSKASDSLGSSVQPLRNLVAYSETEIWFSRSGDAFYQKKRLDYPGISQLLVFDPGRSGEIIVDPKYEDMLVTARHRSIVAGRYKLIYMPTSNGVQYELFDVLDDPHNLRDLSAQRPEVLRSMKSQMISAIRRLEPDVQLLDEFVVPEGI